MLEKEAMPIFIYLCVYKNCDRLKSVCNGCLEQDRDLNSFISHCFCKERVLCACVLKEERL